MNSGLSKGERRYELMYIHPPSGHGLVLCVIVAAVCRFEPADNCASADINLVYINVCRLLQVDSRSISIVRR